MQTCSTFLFMQTPCLPIRKCHATFHPTTKSPTRRNRTEKSLDNALQLTTWTQWPRLLQLAVHETDLCHLLNWIWAHTTHKWKRSVRIWHRPGRWRWFFHLNAMFVTMCHIPPHPARFSRDILAYRSQRHVIETKQSPRKCAPLITENVSLVTRSALKEDKTTIATTVLSATFLHSIAIRASPSQKREPRLPWKINLGRLADEYLQNKTGLPLLVDYAPLALPAVRNMRITQYWVTPLSGTGAKARSRDKFQKCKKRMSPES